MSSFDLKKKNVEDSINDGLVITFTTTAGCFRLKAVNVKPPKAYLDAMDIIQYTKSGSKSDTTKKIYGPIEGNKIMKRQMQIHSNGPSNSCLCCSTFQSLKYRWDR